jgi:hypothetical protein
MWPEALMIFPAIISSPSGLWDPGEMEVRFSFLSSRTPVSAPVAMVAMMGDQIEDGKRLKERRRVSDL